MTPVRELTRSLSPLKNSKCSCCILWVRRSTWERMVEIWVVTATPCSRARTSNVTNRASLPTWPLCLNGSASFPKDFDSRSPSARRKSSQMDEPSPKDNVARGPKPQGPKPSIQRDSKNGSLKQKPLKPWAEEALSPQSCVLQHGTGSPGSPGFHLCPPRSPPKGGFQGHEPSDLFYRPQKGGVKSL